ncbi:MATE family efflux transporter [Carnobacterium gallinarum]|uniref:MATE family efflux transporter n=1 Tax=Carnobacterium gallinarum TaxID=2749 RepID=UPI00054F912D|nr:MATE family efflux transporter [Carnobacterium gallinarum]
MNKNIAKELNQFSLPLVANNLFAILIGSLLAAIIGRISVNAIAATEVVNTFIYSMIGVLGVGTLSFNIYSSRVRLSDPLAFKDYFKSIIQLNMIIGLIFTSLIMLFSSYFLKVLYGFQNDVLTIGVFYAQISSVQILLNMLIFSLSNQMKVKKQTRNILLIGMIGSIFQVVSSLFLVYVVFKNNDYSILGISFANTGTLLLEVCCYFFVLRKDIVALVPIKGSKKLFLLRKSIPLFAQELLEGSIFSVGVTALLSRLGVVSFAAYSVCRRLVDLCLAPMFMYCNGIVVLTGEYIAEKDKKKLLSLPIVGLTLILSIYIGMALVLYLFRPVSIAFFTNKPAIIEKASSILSIVLFTSLTQPFFEVAKMNLQAIGKEKLTLMITGVVNLLILGVLLSLNQSVGLDLTVILFLLASNYLILYVLFTVFYRVEIKKNIKMK